MLEQVKINPCATMFSEIIFRNSDAVAMVSGSFEKPKSNSPGASCASTVKAIITAVTMSAALTKVSRTREPLPAPKFCPEIGPAARGGGTARHLDQAEPARPDAESCLRRRSEIAQHVIDRAHEDED